MRRRSVRVHEWCFLAGVALLPVMRPLDLRIGEVTVIPADVLLVVAGVGAAIGVVRIRFVPLRAAFVALCLAYLAALALASATSTDPAHSARRLLVDAYVVALGVLAFDLVRSDGQRRRVVLAWLAGTGIVVAASTIGLVAHALGVDTPADNVVIAGRGHAPAWALPRVQSLAASPNALCSYLVVSLALVLLAERQRWLPRPLVMALGAATVVSIGLTYSPGIGGAAVTVAAWWFATDRRRAARALAAALGVVGAAGFLVAAVSESDRPAVWRDAAETWLEHPVTGAGPGAQLAAVRSTGTPDDGALLTDAHDVWLNVGGQAGAIGVAALAALVAVLAAQVWRARPLSPVALALVCAALGAVLYHGLTLSLEQTRHVWVLVGLLAASVAPTAARRT